jgi:hypothetical protein
MKRYKVVGVQPFEGHAPGETFDGGLTEGQEEFGIGIGAIKIVSADVAHDKRINPDTADTKPKPKTAKRKRKG